MPHAGKDSLARRSELVSSNYVVVSSRLAGSKSVSWMFRRCEVLVQFPWRSRSDLGMFHASVTAHERCPKLASFELNLVSIEVVSLLIAGRLFLV
jgi:hypothetical protein